MKELSLQRNGKILQKTYLRYFFPTVLTAMATNIAVFADAILAGNLLGGEALAAINLLSPVTQLYFALTVLLGLGASTVITAARGKDDAETADRAFTSVILLAAAICAVLLAIQLPLARPICGMLSADPRLIELSYRYYLPFVLGTPLQIALLCSVYFVRVDGHPNYSSAAVIAANGVNLLMDYLLMGVAKMGIAGSAVATIIGNAVGLSMIAAYYLAGKGKERFLFSLFRSPRTLWKSVLSVLSTGLSGAAGAALVVPRMFFLNYYVQHTGGSDAMIIYSVCSSSGVIVSMFITGAAQAMIPIVSVCYAEKDYDGVKYTLKRAALVMLLCSAAVTAFAMAYPEGLAAMFGSHDLALRGAMVSALRIYALSFPFMAFAYLLLYYDLAVKRKGLSLLAAVLGNIALQIPATCIFGAVWGIEGVWYSFFAAQALALLLSLLAACLFAKLKKNGLGGFYLLPKTGGARFALSYYATEESAAKVSALLQTRFSGPLDPIRANELAVAVEDYTVCLIQRSGRKRVGVDVLLYEAAEGFSVVIRDDGPGKNPLEGEHEPFSPADVVADIAKNTAYSSVLGMNKFSFEVR